MAAPIRTTSIRLKPTVISGLTDITITLEQSLLADHYIEILPGASDILNTPGGVQHLRVTGDPFGNFATVTAANQIQVSRATIDNGTEYLIRVVECTNTAHGSGFIQRGVFELSALDQVQTDSQLHTGVIDTSKCQVVLGGLGSTITTSWKLNSSYVSVYHDATSVNMERNVQFDYGDVHATAYLIEWGSSVTVQKVHINATLPSSNFLSSIADWAVYGISNVASDNTFLTGSFWYKSVSNNGNTAESICFVLGDGVSTSSTENKISVGSMQGGSIANGWVYVITSPDWYVSRNTIGYDTLIAGNVKTGIFSILSPTGTETYKDSINDERAIGTRSLHFRQSTVGNKIAFGSHSVVIVSNTAASWHRGDSDFSNIVAKGVAFTELVDFKGNPIGNILDINGSTSTAAFFEVSGLIVNEDYTDITVTVKDSLSKNVPLASVSISFPGQTSVVGVTDIIGRVTLRVSSTSIGIKTLSINMGPSNIAMVSPPILSFVSPPLNYFERAGMNTGRVTDSNTQDPFIDLFLSGRGINIGDVTGGPFDIEALHDLDVNGFQMSCTTSQSARYVMITSKVSRKAGNYVITYTGGTWIGFTLSDITLFGTASIISHVPGRMVISYPGSGDLFFRISPSVNPMTSANYIKDISCLHVDDEATYDRNVNVWRPEFLASLGKVKILRTMNFSVTNNCPVETWSERPPFNTATCTTEMVRKTNPPVYEQLGVPWEMTIDLANKLMCDLWVCIPHRADNNYVTQLATLVFNSLNPSLRCFFEYSNEAWNPIFSQQAYRINTLMPLYGVNATGNAWNQVYATRACECFSLIDSVFGSETHRRERVLAGQAGNPSMASALTESDVSVAVSPTLTGVASDHADYYAFGGYMGNSTDEATPTASLASMIADDVSKMTPITGEVALNIAGINLNGKLKPICYEGGQHLVIKTVQTEAVITDTNRLPGMREAMFNHLTSWDLITGNAPFCAFDSTQQPGVAGVWGFAENLDAWQTPANFENYKRYGWEDWIATFSSPSDPPPPRRLDAFTLSKGRTPLRNTPRSIRNL